MERISGKRVPFFLLISGYSLTALNRWLQLGMVEGVKLYGKNLISKELSDFLVEAFRDRLDIDE